MGTINNAIPFSLIVWGQTQIASGLASILNATTPLFTVVVATCLLTDERATPLKVLGVVIGFLGVVVMIGLPASSEPRLGCHSWRFYVRRCPMRLAGCMAGVSRPWGFIRF